MTDHFHNFAPCEAVQFDGTNAHECIRFHKTFFIGYSGGLEHHLSPYGKASPGQWLVRQADRVWVQDEEPARVSHISHVIDAQCYYSRCDWCVENRRYYVLTNGARIPVPVGLGDDEMSTP